MNARPQPRFPIDRREAEQVYAQWDRRNGRYFHAADIALADGRRLVGVLFDADSGCAVEVDGRPVWECEDLFAMAIVEHRKVPATARCPACGSGSTDALVAADAWEIGSKSSGERQVVADWRVRAQGRHALLRCQTCGTGFVDPSPSDAELQAFYQSYGGSTVYERKRDSKITRAMRRIRRARRVEAGDRFLDIGCNLGYATEAARRCGYDAVGFDVDADAVARAGESFPGCSFLSGPLDRLDGVPGDFAMVYCSEVIEHMRNPAGLVAAMAGRLRPGGLLYLTTPDYGHWRVPREILAWNEFKPPEHLIWFTKSGLRQLLASHGFRDVDFAFSLKPSLKLTCRRA